jgi:hypothetical protein
MVTGTAFVNACASQTSDQPRVVLKFMSDEGQWQREGRARARGGFDSTHVVGTLRAPADAEVAAAVEARAGGLDGVQSPLGRFMLLMPAGERNLLAIYQSERPEGLILRARVREAADAIAHVHRKGLMHGDIKAVNFVRLALDGRLRLIDFDAAVPIPDSTLGAPPTYAGAKFSSAVLPPEMIHRLNGPEESCANLRRIGRRSAPAQASSGAGSCRPGPGRTGTRCTW